MPSADYSDKMLASVSDQKAAEVPSTPTCDPQAPEKKPDQIQCDPGQKQVRYYTFRDGTGLIVAHMLVPAVTGVLSGVTYVPGTEYWFDVSTSTPARSLTISWEDHSWADTNLPSIGQQSFTMPQGPTWSLSRSTTVAQNATTFVGSGVVLSWNLTRVGSTWQGSLVWFNTTGTNDLFSSATSPVTLVANTSAARLTWYLATVFPVP